MKFQNLTLSLFLLVISFSTFSFDAGKFEQEQCQQTLVPGSRPGFYSVREPLVFNNGSFLTYLQKITFRDESFYVVQNDVKSYQLRSNLRKVRDFVMVDDHVWLIEQEDLIEFDGRGRELNRYRYAPILSKTQKPRGMDLRERKILLAQGSLGLLSFDLDSRTFQQLHLVNTQQENGHRSLATSVTWVGNTAYIALTGNTQNAFNGVVVYDLQSNQMTNASGYRRYRSGVLDPYAKIYFFQNYLYLQNGGWIHELDPQELASKEFIRPKWLPIRHDHQGRNLFLRIRGDFIFDGGEIFGCALVERTPTLAQRKL